MKNGIPSTASKQFNVSCVTLYHKINGKYALDAKSGSNIILTYEGESC